MISSDVALKVRMETVGSIQEALRARAYFRQVEFQQSNVEVAELLQLQGYSSPAGERS